MLYSFRQGKTKDGAARRLGFLNQQITVSFRFPVNRARYSPVVQCLGHWAAVGSVWAQDAVLNVAPDRGCGVHVPGTDRHAHPSRGSALACGVSAI